MAANSILQAIAFEQHQKQLQLQQLQLQQHQQQQQLQQQQLQQQQQEEHQDDIEFGVQRKRKTSCRTGISLSTEQKLQLIDYIHLRPQLWDSNSDGFRSNQTRQAAFNEVAAQLSDDTEAFSRIQIQEEWGKLRYCFTRIVKKLLEEGNGQIDEAQMATISWPYWRRMEFLLPGVRAQLAHQTASTESDGSGQHHQQDNQSRSDMSPSKESVASTTIAATPTKPRKKRSIRKTSNAGVEPLTSLVAATSGDLPSQAALSMSPQELLIAANFSALNSSKSLLSQLQQQQVAERPQQLLNDPNRTTTTTTVGVQRQKSMESAGDYGDLTSVFMNNVGSMSTAELVAALGDIKMATGGTTTQNAIGCCDLLLQQQQQSKQRRELESTLIQPPTTTGSRTATTKREEEPHSPLFSRMSNISTNNINQQSSSSPPFVSATISSSDPSSSQQRQQFQQQSVLSSSNDSAEQRNWGEIGRRESSEPDSGEAFGSDIAESFGRCIVQQLQTVARKNPKLGLQLRHELMDVCFKYEMLAQENGGHG